jgi:hypothetical protein
VPAVEQRLRSQPLSPTNSSIVYTVEPGSHSEQALGSAWFSLTRRLAFGGVGAVC